MDIASIVIWTLSGIIICVLLGKEINNYTSLKSAFSCEHCGKLNSKIKHNDKCEHCNEKIKLENQTWNHFFIHRVTYLRKEYNKEPYIYKKYAKYCKIEIAICLIAMLILLVGVILEIL